MKVNQICQVQMMKKMENYMFNLNDKLGQGSFSQVFRGVNVLTNHQVAVKKIRIGDIKSKIARRLLECEISILRIMDHPNIIKCFDVHSSINNCYIITQMCQGGDLDQFIKIKPQFPHQSIQKIIYSIYQALQYLSNLGIIHRDLKVSNIFIHQDTYKLGDFGFAIKSNKIFKDVAIGSPIYMSPEGLIYNLYGPKTDVWSFGILIYELIHGTTPLAACKTEEQLRNKVLEMPQITKEISPQLRQLMINCLKVSEKERYSIEQIGKSAYIRNIKARMEALMEIQQDYTLTKVTTSTTLTTQSEWNHTFPQISFDAALSLIHYCRFLSKIIILAPSSIFSKLLIWISVNMKKGKYLSKKASLEKESNISQLIKQYSQRFIAEHEIQAPIFINFEEILLECEKKSLQVPNLAQLLKNLQRETQMLMKCLQIECFEQFSKKSKSKQYANSMQIRG